MPDDSFTLYCGNLSEKVTEEILFELFIQAGPVVDVRIPCSNGKKRSFGFVTFKHECSAPYAASLMQDTRLFDRPLDLKARDRNYTPYGNTPSVKDRLGERGMETLRGHSDSRKRHYSDDLLPSNRRRRSDDSLSNQFMGASVMNIGGVGIPISLGPPLGLGLPLGLGPPIGLGPPPPMMFGSGGYERRTRDRYNEPTSSRSQRGSYERDDRDSSRYQRERPSHRPYPDSQSRHRSYDRRRY